jgi:hypothetical protein
MDVPSKAIIDVLTYLLPGFVASALVYILTSAARPIPFERVVQALIYTLLIQALLVVIRVSLTAIGSHCCPLGVWTTDVALIWSVALAILVGVSSAWADNTDCIHSLLRRVGITHQTSFPSEWYGAFAQNAGYVVLHLNGERRLYGWAEEWPSSPERGHFVIAQGEWLTESGSVDLAAVQRILVKAVDVEMVEMMVSKNPKEENDNGRSKGANATASGAEPT